MTLTRDPRSGQLVRKLRDLRRRVRELETMVGDGARAEAESERLAAGLEAVGHLAVDLAAAPRDANLRQIIGDSLRAITGALFVLVTRYDAPTRALVVEYVSCSDEVRERLVQVMGSDMTSMRVPLSAEYYAEMLNLGTRTQADAASSSMGAVPRDVSDAMGAALGIGHFAALALCYGEQLMGTAVLAMGTGHQSPLPQVMRIFAHAAAVSLQRQEAQNTLQAKMLELRQTQAQLVHTAKMAAIGELSAGIAHELNNPLTSILGYAEYLLERGEYDPREVRRLEAIASQARRARDVVRSLLDYARCEKSVQEPTALNPVVRSGLDLVRDRLSQTAIDLDEQYAPDLPLLGLDAGKMKHVFLNLCTNAVQAMPDGGSLRVWTEQREGSVTVGFADTGEGIPAENLERIFEPFFTTRTNGQGTGLGLAVSQDIVKEHGGRIEVQSQVGVGSTVTVWLPCPAGDTP